MKAHLEYKGIDQLMKHLNKAVTLDDVKKVVLTNGAELNEGMQKRAEFKGHYHNGEFVKPTGATRRSITMKIQEAGFSVLVMPHTEYAPYLETGTRFMDAQPFVRPAFNYQKLKFMSDMRRLVS
jgi:HK97 gp10 family phage protein|nr:MAG TPA: putative tail component [Caudoviricetes sp.]